MADKRSIEAAPWAAPRSDYRWLGRTTMMYFGKMNVVIFALSLAIVGTTNAQFAIENLTNTDGAEATPRINASGQAIWSLDGEIFLYNGTAITQITHTTFGNDTPDIDNNGNVAWRGTLTPGGDSEGQHRISFLGWFIDYAVNEQLVYRSTQPRISNGKVVWTSNVALEAQTPTPSCSTGVPLHRSLTIASSDSDPRISGNGDAFWVGEAAGPNAAGNEIFRFDGNSITRLTDNAYEDSDSESEQRGASCLDG